MMSPSLAGCWSRRRLRADDPSDAPDAEKATDAANSPAGGSVKGVVTFDRRLNDHGWAEDRTVRHSKRGGASGYVPLWDQWGGLPYQDRPRSCAPGYHRSRGYYGDSIDVAPAFGRADGRR